MQEALGTFFKVCKGYVIVTSIRQFCFGVTMGLVFCVDRVAMELVGHEAKLTEVCEMEREGGIASRETGLLEGTEAAKALAWSGPDPRSTLVGTWSHGPSVWSWSEAMEQKGRLSSVNPRCWFFSPTCCRSDIKKNTLKALF